MSSTGTPGILPRSDELTLYEAMSLIAGLPAAPLVAVHAESETITSGLARRARDEGRLGGPRLPENATGRRRDRGDRDPRSSWRTPTGCRLHIVHVSTGRGVALVAEARAPRNRRQLRGHRPPPAADRRRRRAAGGDGQVRATAAPRSRVPRRCGPGSRHGDVSFVVSDHSPSLPHLREGDPFASWGGIPGLSVHTRAAADPRPAVAARSDRARRRRGRPAVLAARQRVAGARGTTPTSRSSSSGSGACSRRMSCVIAIA